MVCKRCEFVSFALHSLPTAILDKGEIIACRINAPGSWHDAHVARPIYGKLHDATPAGYYLVSATAFPQGSQQISGPIKAPMKQGAHLPQNAEEREVFGI
jgi:hypothetical protein